MRYRRLLAMRMFVSAICQRVGHYRVYMGPCICRLFLCRYTNCQSKNGKRTLYPFFVFLSAIRKKENDYKQTILVFLIYERKRKTVQQTVFRFLCIRTENEMRLQRHSFSVFRFPFDATVPCICLCAERPKMDGAMWS